MSAPVLTRRNFIKTAAVGMLGAGLGGPRLWSAVSGARRPNVLLVFPDQLRFDWTGLTAGAAVRTPNLVRLAKEGMQFDRAYCPTPLCAPSRACLATGRAYGRTGVVTNKDNLPDETATFYQQLRDAGYQVANAGKLDLRKAASDWGADGLHRVGSHRYYAEWGFTAGFDSEGKNARARENPGPYIAMLQHRTDEAFATYTAWHKAKKRSPLKPVNYAYTTPVALPDDAYNDNWVGRRALDQIDAFAPDRPWFLQVNFPGPHAPMDITPPMAGWYRGTAFPPPVAGTRLAPDVHQAIRRNYSAMVENIDRWLGRYLDLLERRGEQDRTLVVFSSDHGEMLGDHDRWGKRSPLQPSVSVPLVIRGPEVRRGIVHRGPASTLDLSATFLDYAGLAAAADGDSQSLRPLLGGRTSGRRHVTSGYGGWRLATDGRYKLIRGFDPAAINTDFNDRDDDASIGETAAVAPDAPLALFDLETDPHELNNLVAQRPALVARLQKHLPAT
jgi:arylsulfatase A-like enzyme